MAEALKRGGAIERRGFVQLAGNALQPRNADEHVVAEVLPGGHQDDGRHRPVRIAEPVDGMDADMPEHPVEESVARVVQIAPHDGDGHEGRHEWREEDSAGGGLPAERTGVHEQCGTERGRHSERPADDGEVECVAECLPEEWLMQHAHVVAQANPARGARIGERIQIEVSETEPHRRNHRPQKEHDDQ